MIEFKDLTLEDKPIIDQYFQIVQPRNSECTFTNMFIWRDCYEVQWTIIEGLLIIKPGQMEETWILQPYGDYTNCNLRKVFAHLDEYFSSQGLPFIMRAVTESFAELLETEYPGMFYLEDERDLADYMYLGPCGPSVCRSTCPDFSRRESPESSVSFPFCVGSCLCRRS